MNRRTVTRPTTARPTTRGLTAAGAAALTLATAAAARADVTVSIPASQDATLFGGAETTASASGPALFVGSDPSNPLRGLVAFDVAAYIPAGETVTGASLALVLGQVAGGANADATPRSIGLFDVTRAWRGGTNGTTGRPGPGFGGTGHGFPANPGDATWTYAASPTTPWTTPGGDFTPTASAKAVVGQSVGSAYTWASTPQTVADVQAWLTGTTANDGWLLKSDGEAVPTSFRAFYTAEGAAEQNVAADAPVLTVTYAPVAVPEPASLAAAAAAAGLLRRRRPVAA